jgi:deoxyribose-phosphate aldolase
MPPVGRIRLDVSRNASDASLRAQARQALLAWTSVLSQSSVGTGLENDMTKLAKMIEHCVAHPATTDDALVAGCDMAERFGVATVCVKPYAVLLARDLLGDSSVAVNTIVGFPFGSGKIDVKVHEAREALRDGCAEIDMIVNVGKVLSDDWDYVRYEVASVNEEALSFGAALKVIFETDFYDEDRYVARLCELCSELEVPFVASSSGFGFTSPRYEMSTYNRAAYHDLKLMQRTLGPEVQIKVGAVRTLDDLLRLRALGVRRVGSVTTEKILLDAWSRERHRPMQSAV